MLMKKTMEVLIDRAGQGSTPLWFCPEWMVIIFPQRSLDYCLPPKIFRPSYSSDWVTVIYLWLSSDINAYCQILPVEKCWPVSLYYRPICIGQWKIVWTYNRLYRYLRLTAITILLTNGLDKFSTEQIWALFLQYFLVAVIWEAISLVFFMNISDRNRC
jgi:hypothetical protein